MRSKQKLHSKKALSPFLMVLLLCASLSAFASVLVPQIPLPGAGIPKFVEAVPTFVGPGYNLRIDGTLPLEVRIQELQEYVLPTSLYTLLVPPFNAGTFVWGYKVSDGITTFGPYWPADTIEAQKGIPTNVSYYNDLYSPYLQQYLTVDQTLHWANPFGLSMMDPLAFLPYTGPIPTCVHLHGAEVPSAFDGGPDQWFTPGFGIVGSGFVSNQFTYPNGQEATTMFYHDHALGITRINVYSGMAGFYLLRDEFDTGVPGTGLNLPAEPYEIELAIQDRMFDTNGQLLFPDVGINPTMHPYWMPEFFGDVICVNGKSWPFLNVEPRRYRFRLVNGSNARFYNLFFTAPGPIIYQIGSDGGLLDAPVKLPQLLIGTGERADIIVDFSAFAGQTLLLKNNAKAPFPNGAPAQGATTGQIMQFRVGTTVTGGPDTSFNPAIIGATLRGGLNQPPAVVRLTNKVGGLGAGVVVDKTRQLTLNEVMGMLGPLEALLNNSKWMGEMSPNAGGITETPQVGSTEVWEIVNTTGDTHPIHLHLVQFQLINRQAFSPGKYAAAYNAAFPAVTFDGVVYPGGMYIPAYGPPLPYNSTLPIVGGKLGGNPDVTPYLMGKAKPPNANETGWKDTFLMYPGEVTRVLVRFAPQNIAVGGTTPGLNLFPFDPTAPMGTTDIFGYPGGPGYVWHCHIIDHEDNEMMRPYTVAP
jgi:FtsP/CotA-like multicopper oxidase with cupredoxin domain